LLENTSKRVNLSLKNGKSADFDAERGPGVLPEH
jgi:hypothetical protein